MDHQSPSSPDQDKAPETNQGGLGKFWAELKRRHVVRVAAVYAVVGWLIIQVANATFADFGIPVWAYRFVVLMVVLGFPISLVIAWAFELTPQGIKTTKTAREDHPESHEDASHAKKRSWLAYAVGAAVPTVIFSVLALFFYIRSGGGGSNFEGEKSIAVLPFDNRSNLDDDLYFTDGFHDELITHISKIKDIKTIARTSVMGYRGTTQRMSEIGEELNVRYLVEGGVQRGGDEIRIVVQLIDTTTEGHVWAENYTREMSAKNVFNIQTEICRIIASELKAVLSPEEEQQIDKVPTENMAALEAYFKGKEKYLKTTTADIKEAMVHFEEAIEHDPDFAMAHAMIAFCYLNFVSRLGLSPEVGYTKVKTYLTRALELDNTLSEAYRGLGALNRRQGNLGEAEIAFVKAIDLDPNNASAYVSYAVLKNDRNGRTPQVADLYRKSYDLDPKHPRAKDRLASSYEALGQWAMALEIRTASIEEEPEFADNYRELGYIYLYQLGRIDEAIVTLRKFLALDPGAQNVKSNLSDAYLNLGDTEQALWWIDRYLATQQDPVMSAEWMAWKFKLLGNKAKEEEAALDGLQIEPKHQWLLNHLTDLYIASGQIEKLRTRWSQAFPSFFESSPQVEWIDIWAAKDAVRVFEANGENEQADKLIEEIFAVLNSAALDSRRMRLEVLLPAITGDDRQTLDSIRRFFDSGGSPYFLELRDELKPYFDHPEYQAMAEKRKAELAIQLERIKKMEAAGQLAPIPEHLRD